MNDMGRERLLIKEVGKDGFQEQSGKEKRIVV